MKMQGVPSIRPGAATGKVVSCEKCGQPFYAAGWDLKTGRRFCTSACRDAAHQGSKNLKRKVQAICAYCDKPFFFSPSEKRKFCSFKCYRDSGGLFIASMKSCEGTMRYAPRKDNNHQTIVEAFRRLGVQFFDLSAMGRGAPDGLAGVNKAWHFVEIKNPLTQYGKRGLNPTQKRWASQWHGCDIFIIKTIEQVEKFAAGKLDELEKYVCGITPKAEKGDKP